MSSHNQPLANQEHSSLDTSMGAESEAQIQRSAVPPPFQLSAGADFNKLAEEESDGLSELEPEGPAQSDSFAAAPPPPMDGSGSQFPVQRQTDQEIWDTPIATSTWTGKAARVKSEGYRVWPDRDRVEGTQVAALPFNTYVNVLNEYPQSWLEILTQGGVHGFVGIPEQNLQLCPEADPTADMYQVQGGESAWIIAQRHYSEYATFGADLRYFIALIARLNNIDVGNDIDSWKDTQLQAGQIIFLPTIYYATAMEGIVSSGSYTAEGIRFIQDAAQAIERIRQDISESLDIAQAIVEAGWMNAIMEGFVGATEDKIQELIRRFKIVAATTAAGAIIAAAVTGGAGTLVGAQMGMQLGNSIVNGIELFEGIAGILELAAFFIGELSDYLILILNPDGLPENAEQAGAVLGNAILALIREVTSEVVGGALSPGGDGGNSDRRTTDIGDGTNTSPDFDASSHDATSDLSTTIDRPETDITPTVVDPSTQNTTGDSIAVDGVLSNRAQQAGLVIPEGHPLWQRLDDGHIDDFDAIPAAHKASVASFLLDDNPYSTPEGRLAMLAKVDDWPGLYTFAADRGINPHLAMLALSNPGIRNVAALGNLLDRFTIDEILQQWSVFPGSLPVGTDPYNTGTPAVDSAPAGPVTTVDPNTLDAVDISTLAGNRLEAYNFFTSQGLTARAEGSSVAFFTPEGALVARADNSATTFPYTGFGGDIVAPAGQTTTLLGRYADLIDGGGTRVFIGQNTSTTGPNSGGLNVLNINPWTLGLNVSWLMDAINRGDNIRLISDPSHVPNYFGGDGGISVTAHEIGILIDQGVLDASVLPAGLPFTPEQLLPDDYLNTVGRQRTGGN